MSKNESPLLPKLKSSYALIERIIVIGVTPEDVIKSLSQNKLSSQSPSLSPSEISSLKIKIIEEYKSNEIKESPGDNYIENISIFCMPNGLKWTEENKMKTNIHSFSLITNASKRKHCSCLTYYETYEYKDKKISLLKALCVVSSRAIYSTHLEILNNIFGIVSNYKINKTMFPEQLKYVYLKDKVKSYTVLKEYSILEFYFSFLLNSIKFPENEAAYFINYIGNNTGKKCFTKFYLNDGSGYPLADHDMTMLLDKFNVEDLIKIQMCLLMEYKLILIFEDYQDINPLIFSLTNLIYPLKWNFPIISFITPTLIETLEAPFGMIIGVHSKYLNIVNAKLNQSDAITEETLIYNLNNKSFVFMPKKFPTLPMKLLNELRSNIYLVLSEKLSLSSDYDNYDSELYKMFPNAELCKKIDHIPFLNLKLIGVFYNLFLELIKNFESSIYFNKIKSIKNSKEKFHLYDVFDFTKFINDRDFHNDKSYLSFLEQFSKTLMFMQFLDKYIKNSDEKPKYKLVKKMINVLNKENGKSIVKDLNREYVKNKLISYNNFRYISLEDALKNYIEKFGNLTTDNRNGSSDDKYIWNPLDNLKIINFSIFFEKYRLSESDDRIKDHANRKLYLELVKFKEYKKYEIEDDEEVHTQSINYHETKMKSNLEGDYFKKGIKPSLNLPLSTSTHKPSPSYNINNAIKINKLKPNPIINTTIQCNNNIGNFYYNNINISSEELKDKFQNINLSSANITSTTNWNKKQDFPTNNTINSIGDLRSLHSISTSNIYNSVVGKTNLNTNTNINTNTSAYNSKFNSNPFISENFTSRIGNENSIRRSNIVNLKQSNQNTKDSNKDRLMFMNKLEKNNKNLNNRANDFTEFIKLTKLTTNTSRNSNKINNKANGNVNVNTQSNDSLMNDSIKKFRVTKLKDPNMSINISPLRRNELDQSNQSVKSNHLSKIKNTENISKLAGDEEFDLFSDGENECRFIRK